MNAAIRERVWMWSTRIAPCAGALIFLLAGWESLPPWHAPADRTLPIERGGAPLERFASAERSAARAGDGAQEAAAGEDRAATDAIGDRSTAGEGRIAARASDDAANDAGTQGEAVADAAGSDAAISGGEASATAYWINLRSGVRHNRECRYFDPTGDGRYCGPDEGRACRVCGG